MIALNDPIRPKRLSPRVVSLPPDPAKEAETEMQRLAEELERLWTPA